MVNAFDDAGFRVELRNAPPQFVSVAVAFRNKDRARARQMGGWLTQGAARKQSLVAGWLLKVDQHNVPTPAPQLPVLESIIEQERVTAEFLDGVAPAFHPILVHEHDHVF